MTPGTPPHIRKLLPCGSRQARPISQSFSDIRTPSSGGRQSIGTVGFNGPPDGSPRVGKTPMRGVASPYISPSSGEIPTSVPVTVRGPAKLRGAVSEKGLVTAKCLAGARAALTLPVLLPTCSMWAAPSRSQTVSQGLMPLQRPVPIPSKGAVPPRPVVSISMQQPGKKAVVNRGHASIVKCSQVPSVTPEPLRCPAPVPSKHAASLCFTSNKAKPLIEVVATRCKPSVVSTIQLAAAEAHQGAAASMKALRAVTLQQSGDLMSSPSPDKGPVAQESTQVKRTVETAPKGCSAKRPMNRQGHSFSGEEGEERQV